MLNILFFLKKEKVLILFLFLPLFQLLVLFKFSKLKENFPLKSQEQLKVKKIKVGSFKSRQNILTFHTAWEGGREVYTFLDNLFFIT